jgi:hypothetical protein
MLLALYSFWVFIVSRVVGEDDGGYLTWGAEFLAHGSRYITGLTESICTLHDIGLSLLNCR